MAALLLLRGAHRAAAAVAAVPRVAAGNVHTAPAALAAADTAASTAATAAAPGAGIPANSAFLITLRRSTIGTRPPPAPPRKAALHARAIPRSRSVRHHSVWGG